MSLSKSETVPGDWDPGGSTSSISISDSCGMAGDPESGQDLGDHPGHGVLCRVLQNLTLRSP